VTPCAAAAAPLAARDVTSSTSLARLHRRRCTAWRHLRRLPPPRRRQETVTRGTARARGAGAGLRGRRRRAHASGCICTVYICTVYICSIPPTMMSLPSDRRRFFMVKRSHVSCQENVTQSIPVTPSRKTEAQEARQLDARRADTPAVAWRRSRLRSGWPCTNVTGRAFNS
jgi:hypothetical protein